MNTIGVVGFGNMGSCLARAFKAQNNEIYVFDKDPTRTVGVVDFEVVSSIADLLEKVEVVVLAVKPQDFGDLLNEVKQSIEGKVIISIAAGVTTNYINKYLGEVSVIRAMPNMAARIGQSMTCLCKGSFAKNEDLLLAKGLFDSVGNTLTVDDEDMINAATAISGSGPGYFFDLMQTKQIDINNTLEIEKFRVEFSAELSKAAEAIGFNNHDAIKLAEVTGRGSVELFKTSNLSLEELVKQIASKGGTTEAALGILHTEGTLEDAVKSARDRARELSRN